MDKFVVVVRKLVLYPAVPGPHLLHGGGEGMLKPDPSSPPPPPTATLSEQHINI